MIYRPNVRLILATGAAMAFAGAAQAQTDAAKAECERLIDAIRPGSPTQAYDALEKMDVYRKGNQYQACIDAGRGAQRAAAEQPEGTSVKVGSLIGHDVFNDRGADIGNVDRIVRDGSGTYYAFVTYRGPRWPGNKQMALPLDRMSLHAGRLIMPGVTEDDLLHTSSVDHDGRTYTALDSKQQISLHGIAPTATGTVPRTK